MESEQLLDERDEAPSSCVDFQSAVRSLLATLCFTSSYHVLILTHVVPYKYVWGGRLTSEEQMLHFEIVSLCINLLLLLLVLLRGNLLRLQVPQQVLKPLLGSVSLHNASCKALWPFRSRLRTEYLGQRLGEDMVREALYASDAHHVSTLPAAHLLSSLAVGLDPTPARCTEGEWRSQGKGECLNSPQFYISLRFMLRSRDLHLLMSI